MLPNRIVMGILTWTGLVFAVPPAYGQQPCELAKLVPSDGGGGQVGISGDFAVVGDPTDGDLGFWAGAVYIFKREGTNWVEQVKLTASDGGPNDRFGGAVSVDGDFAVVGAVGLTEFGGDGFGAAYVFRYEGGEWVEETKLIPSAPDVDDFFGRSVAIEGDRIVVGASEGILDPGSAYVFRRELASWVMEAALAASDGAAADFFGSWVSISGNLVVIGAPGNDDAGSRSGSAYVFRKENTTWVEDAKLTASDAAPFDLFGSSVSNSTEYVLVGAFGNDDAGATSGSAYIFRRNGGNWVEDAKLTASDAAAFDRFGVSVAVEGDLVLVGANGDDDAAQNSGSVYLFRREGMAWAERYKLLASDAIPEQGFGGSVALDGRFAAVGATYVFAVGGDCNGNGVADPCDVFDGTPDCNDNVVPDTCDIAEGTSTDFNANAVPDECETLVPTLSHWGLIILALLLLITAKTRFRRLGNNSRGECIAMFCLAATVTLGSTGSAFGQPNLDAAHHPEQLLVRFHPGVSDDDRDALNDAVGAEVLREYRHLTGLYLVRVPEEQLETALFQYIDSPLVLYAEPDYLGALAAVPNDEHFPKLWGMDNTGQTVNGDPGTVGADIRARSKSAVPIGKGPHSGDSRQCRSRLICPRVAVGSFLQVSAPAAEGLAKKVFDLGVEAAQIVLGPPV